MSESPRPRNRFVRRPRYADVASTLALVLALGTGGAYAANTVGSKDIKRGAVKAGHLAKGAVKPGKIAPRAVRPRHLSPAIRNQLGTAGPQGPAGPQGEVGPQGETGAQGPSGFTGYEVIYQSLPQLAAGTSTEQRVACPAGKAASAGGFHASGSDTFATRSAPSFSGDLWAPGVGSDHPNEWTVGLRNDGSTAAFPAAWVVCIDLED